MLLRRALPAVIVFGAIAGWLAAPVRWRVEGVSMAPGLMPGDVAASGWFPWVDRWRSPRRFERWTLFEPGGAMAVKRVWGLPGEDITLIEGDLAVNGAVVVKPPAVLAEMALTVACTGRQDTGLAVRVAIDDLVLDDVPFAPHEQRRLVPVSDVGIVALVSAGASARADPPAFDVVVGDRKARVHLPTAGRMAVVAGRLDGCFVAAAWPVGEGVAAASAALPSGAPGRWGLECPWIDRSPVTVLQVELADGSQAADVRIEHVAAWRDVHFLPPADGTSHWRLGPAECFVLGDFSGGSRDSRHWGPLDVARLRQRLAPAAP